MLQVGRQAPNLNRRIASAILGHALPIARAWSLSPEYISTRQQTLDTKLTESARTNQRSVWRMKCAWPQNPFLRTEIFAGSIAIPVFPETGPPLASTPSEKKRRRERTLYQTYVQRSDCLVLQSMTRYPMHTPSATIAPESSEVASQTRVMIRDHSGTRADVRTRLPTGYAMGKVRRPMALSPSMSLKSCTWIVVKIAIAFRIWTSTLGTRFSQAILLPSERLSGTHSACADIKAYRGAPREQPRY